MPISNTNLGKGVLTKNYSDTYLYNISDMYEKKLFKFIMHGEEINKLDPSFESIQFDLKRRKVNTSLLKVLNSKNVILLKGPEPLPRAFKVFVSKDIKNGNRNTLKVFIDADVINVIDGSYSIRSEDVNKLIGYLVSATNSMVYYADPKRLLMRREIINNGAKCFAKLFTYVIDYLFKVSNISSSRDRCLYLSCMYYLVNILKKEMNDSTKHICRTVSGLSEREEEILLILTNEDTFSNIKFFIDTLGPILKLNKLTLDAFLEKWIYLYGNGTQFALELYPAFATMITNVYIGCYLNNQKTIENILKDQIVPFSTAILNVGAESV